MAVLTNDICKHCGNCEHRYFKQQGICITEFCTLQTKCRNGKHYKAPNFMVMRNRPMPDDNQIVDNRIVSDKTFAVRLKSFIEQVQVCDAISEEEQEYLLNVADRLIEYQRATVTTDEERTYFRNLQIEV